MIQSQRPNARLKRAVTFAACYKVKFQLEEAGLLSQARSWTATLLGVPSLGLHIGELSS